MPLDAMQNPSAQILACLRRLLVIMCLAGVLTGISANHPGKAEAGDKRHFEYPVRFHLRFLGHGKPFNAFASYNQYYNIDKKEWPLEYFKQPFDAGYIEISKGYVLAYRATDSPSKKVFEHLVKRINRVGSFSLCDISHIIFSGQPLSPLQKAGLPCSADVKSPLFAPLLLLHLKERFMLYPTKIEGGYK